MAVKLEKKRDKDEQANEIKTQRQKVGKSKLTALYRHLNVTDKDSYNINEINLKRFSCTAYSKKDIMVLKFHKDNEQYRNWVNLTKRNSNLYSASSLKSIFGRVDAVRRSVLNLDETPPVIKRSNKAAIKLMDELPANIKMECIPPLELPSLAENIHVKTREASQNTDLDMLESLGIDKALQSIQDEPASNTSKLTETDKCITEDSKKLNMVLLILKNKGSNLEIG